MTLHDNPFYLKHQRPLGPKAFAHLMEDLPHAMDAITHDDEYCELYADWCDWRVVCRLAHEVHRYRLMDAAQPKMSIRAQRIAQGNYTEEDFWDT